MDIDAFGLEDSIDSEKVRNRKSTYFTYVIF